MEQLLLIRDGVPHRRGWTREAVKDIWRRGRVYLGYIVEKRGRDERPGRHEPTLSEAEYRRTVAAVRARTRVGNKPRPFRNYILRGLLHCSCGTRMRGEAHVQPSGERRFYRCPKVGCLARRSSADVVEQEVLSRIAAAVVPESVIEAARHELRKRTQTPATATEGKQRARLMTRLEQLKKQHSWGDISDDEYGFERDATQAAMARLPGGDRVVAFDTHCAHILALPDAIAVASPQRREELCRIVVERVVVDDRKLVEIEWTPAAQPFLKRQREYPQGGSSTRPLSDDATDDVLAWYVA